MCGKSKNFHSFIITIKRCIKVKNISIVVNIYIDTKPEMENTFDHPTDFEKFDSENTFTHTLESINKLNVPSGYMFNMFIFAIAANNDISKDILIREKIACLVKNCTYDVFIITNSNIRDLNTTGYDLLSTKGYCEIRNLGFIFPYFNNSDFVVQIDDDEILRENYLTKMVEIYENNPDIYVLNGLYEKDGKVLVDETNDYENLKQCYAMNEDIRRLSSADKPVEAMFGLGGNMTFKREFFSQICYPENLPRGEDFALLLATSLVYFNGNDKCKIQPGNSVFKTFFTSNKEMTIIHRPPYSPSKNKLKYLELNFERFIMQKSMLKNYIQRDKFYTLTRYMYRMLTVDDYLDLVNKIYDEATEKYPEDCPEDKVENAKNKTEEIFYEYNKRDLFDEYKKYQDKYLSFLKNNRINVKKYLF